MTRETTGSRGGSSFGPAILGSARSVKLRGLGAASLALCSVLGAARETHAQPETMPPPVDERVVTSGFQAGLRLGYAMPSGKVTNLEGDALSYGVGAGPSAWLDLGYRFNRYVFAGAYGQMTYGSFGGAFDPFEICSEANASCTAYDWRAGLQAQVSIPLGSVAPWVGVGLGWEWLVSTADLERSSEYGFAPNGPEAHLQAGLDWAIRPNMLLGPFVSYSFGQYRSLSITCEGRIECEQLSSEAGTIADPALHQWLVVGLRFAAFK